MRWCAGGLRCYDVMIIQSSLLGREYWSEWGLYSPGKAESASREPKLSKKKRHYCLKYSWLWSLAAIARSEQGHGLPTLKWAYQTPNSSIHSFLHFHVHTYTTCHGISFIQLPLLTFPPVILYVDVGFTDHFGLCTQRRSLTSPIPFIIYLSCFIFHTIDFLF